MLDSNSISFAKACIDNGIIKLDSSARLERAKLIAKQKGIANYENTNNLQKIIYDYLSEEEEKKQAQKKKALEKLKQNEIENKKELEKYAELKGREKCIEYYNDIIRNYDRIISRREDALELAKTTKIAYSALNSSIEPMKSPPEQDWAIAGGIASALAGPAAGISVASDIQRKNAESRIDPHEAARSVEIQRIKNTNTANSLAQHFLDSCSVSDEEYRSARHTKDDYIKLQEQSELLLVDNTVDPHRLMSALSPSIVSSEITASGSVHISLIVSGGVYRIYEDVPALIDGSFKMLLWDKEGTFHGMASAVLPMFGVSTDTILEAWFTEPQEPQASIEEYDIRLVKPNLWLLETSGDLKNNKTIIEETNIDKEAETYCDAYILSQSKNKNEIIKAEQLFLSLDGWKDSKKQSARCSSLVKLLEVAEKAKEEQGQLKAEKIKQENLRKVELEKQRQLEKKKIKFSILAVVICLILLTIAAQVGKVITLEKAQKEYYDALEEKMQGIFDDEECKRYTLYKIDYTVTGLKQTQDGTYLVSVLVNCETSDKGIDSFDKKSLAWTVEDYVPGYHSDVKTSYGSVSLYDPDYNSRYHGKRMLTIVVNGDQVVAPEEKKSESSSSFTNEYGTASTKCAHPGCSNYIASSGDTNCCTKHSNKCLNCGKYIDEDASYCMSCLSDALGSK